MNTQNITLAISKEVLSKARQLALERHTSLSALVTQIIVDLVDQDDKYRSACERQLSLLEKGLDLDTHGVANWAREELHER
jgi:predicted transcriptional regulator